MCIIGGPSNINGAIIGALFMRGIERGTRILKDYVNMPIDPNNFMFIITGILMIFFIMYKPEGIIKEKRMEIE
jgi:branched-chain amino acid transport system permease protein